MAKGNFQFFFIYMKKFLMNEEGIQLWLDNEWNGRPYGMWK
jgi:hypothetical protein